MVFDELVNDISEVFVYYSFCLLDVILGQLAEILNTLHTQLQAAATILSGYYFLHFAVNVRVLNESGLYLSAGHKHARTLSQLHKNPRDQRRSTVTAHF